MFYQLYALGPDETTTNYYPNASESLLVGQRLMWYIEASNEMGSVQFVSIRVKLSNQTIDPPNDTTAIPSPAPSVTEFRRFMQDNETWIIPFTWQIKNLTRTDGRIRIAELQIGNMTYSIQNSPTCSNLASCRFSLIFELWTWNVNDADFQFGWWTGDQHQVAWLQIWFGVLPPSPK